MRGIVKGAASYIGSALWWITQQLYGDAILKWLQPMIPAWAIHPTLADWVWWAISFGPPLLLVLIGTYFFVRSGSNPTHSTTELYLHSNSSLTNQAVCDFVILWSPRDYFHFYFSDYESYSRSIPPKPPKRTHFSVYATNVGPGAIRHVKIRWQLERIDVPRLVRASGLFGNHVRIIEHNLFELYGDNGGIVSPLSSDQHSEVAKMDDGETIELKAPAPFAAMLNLYALGEAKKLNDATQGQAASSLFAILRNGERRLHPITIDLEYFNESGAKKRHKYYITSSIRGGSPLKRDKDPGSENTYSMEPDGILAWMCHIKARRA